MGIRIDNIVKHFGDFVALNDVSVDIPSGSLDCAARPSGGGKSTRHHHQVGRIYIPGKTSPRHRQTWPTLGSSSSTTWCSST